MIKVMSSTTTDTGNDTYPGPRSTNTNYEGPSSAEEEKKEPPANTNITIDYNIMSVQFLTLNISTMNDLNIWQVPTSETSPLGNIFNNRGSSPPTAPPAVPKSDTLNVLNTQSFNVRSRSEEFKIPEPQRTSPTLHINVPRTHEISGPPGGVPGPPGISSSIHNARVIYKKLPGLDDILHEKPKSPQPPP